MLAFVISAAAMSIAAALVVLLAHRWPGAGKGSPMARRELNVAVLRQQLTELDRDHLAGLLPERDYVDARALLMRRLLDDAGAPEPTAGGVSAPRRAVLGVALLLPLGAVLLYSAFGSPQSIGRHDGRHDAASASAAELQAHLRRHGDDARAWVMLGREQLVAERWTEAAHAFARATAESDKVARDAQVWCDWADAAGMAQGGSLLGEPERLIARALELDALRPCALELAGSAAIERRDFRAARDHWQRLLARLPEGSAQRAELTQALARVEQQARFALPR